MGISEGGLFEIMSAMIGVQKQRNVIEKDLRKKSDR